MGYRPQFYILILCISVVFSAQTGAQQNRGMKQDGITYKLPFSLSPTTCVTSKSNDLCEMDLRIVLEDSSVKDNFCIFLSSNSLGCWYSQNFPKYISIKLLRTEQLIIKKEDGSAVFSKTLLVKYIEPIKKRRRINNPWSIF